MRKAIGILLLALVSIAAPLRAQFPGQAAPVDPVKWSISRVQVAEGEWQVIFRADIQKGWSVYSQQDFGSGGPAPTRVYFDTLAHVRLKGSMEENGEHVVQGHDVVFDMEVKKFKGWAVFTRTLVVTDPKLPITGKLEYMTCDDLQCLFPDPKYFKIILSEDRGEFNNLPFPKENAGTSFSQTASPLDPVKWSGSVLDKGDGHWVVVFNAVAEKGWYVYSLESFGDMGPMPTGIDLDTIPGVARVGKPTEAGPDMHEGYDEMFDMNVRKYVGSATFTQELSASDPSVPITGAINYQTCDDTRCTFPDPLKFSIDLKAGTVTLGLKPQAVADTNGTDSTGFVYVINTIDAANPTDDCGIAKEEESSLWWLFFVGFLGGLVALFTPCVFPMIPLTVSFFTKGSEDKRKGRMNAIMYGLFIFLIYFAISLPFHLLKIRPEIFHEFATSISLNLVFFGVFVFFAFSFFGYYEITLPSSFTNKMDAKAGSTGGMIGVFFMAVTLALVSFSCTGPILGTFLGSIFEKGPNALSVVMAGFGVALGLPFGLFALFPRWLNSLPKSGGWLNTVKVSLGFVELALAIKFVANADNVIQWGIMKREIFFAIWILLGIAWALYLFQAYYFPHDSRGLKISTGRRVFAMAIIGFCAYLAPGLTNTSYRNVKLVSGFPPPLFYSIYEQDTECPLGLTCFHDYKEGMDYALAHDKPVLLDFTGWACVNCRRMEENVWPEETIFKKLNDDFVLISLYVDDRKQLPADEQKASYTTKDGVVKEIRTYGQRWITLQQENFRNISQPWYVVISPDEHLMTPPVGYTPDEEDYNAWLQCGINAYQRHKAVAQVK